jgi:hypothetical protein
MRHAAALDLSAQQLPADCITQLAQHMPRLKSLKLDACKLSADQLCSLANFADANRTAGADGVGLSQLSLAGIQLSRPSALPAREGTSRKDRLHAELLAQQAVRDAIDLRAAPGAADVGTSVRGVDTLEVLLDAIAANALTHLNLCRTVQVRGPWSCLCWRAGEALSVWPFQHCARPAGQQQQRHSQPRLQPASQ